MTGAPAEHTLITKLFWIKNRKHILTDSFRPISQQIIDFYLEYLQT